MANFIKVVLFLIVVVSIGIYFFSHLPQIFQGSPQERIFSSNSNSGFLGFQYSVPSTPITPNYINSPTTVISSQSTQIPNYLIPAGYTRQQLSPYFQKIRISSAYVSSYINYLASQFQLYAYLPTGQAGLSNGERIDITGWKVETNHGGFTIPQAVNIYAPLGSYGSSPEENINIPGNANISIYSDKSPVGANFRLNKCTGYLANNYSFNPSLPQICPTISRSEISYLSGQCQNYIFSLGSCKEPNISIYNSFPGNDEGNACRQFLSNINAITCFQKHHGDADFLSNEWRIWMNWTGINSILDSQHDTVRLLDKSGLLVDQYIY